MKYNFLMFFLSFFITLETFSQVGLIDPDFKPGTGFGPDKWTGKCEVIVQKDGNIALVGYFDYNPIGIMRLIGDAPDPVNSVKSFEKQFSVYPNPANQMLFISELQKGSNVFIHDLSGNEVFKTNMEKTSELVINSSTLRNGLYLIRIESKQGVHLSKLLIQH